MSTKTKMGNPIKSMVDSYKSQTNAMKEQAATECFNIVRIDGKDYITYNGIVISRDTDDDLLDRLDEIRRKHIESVR